MKSPIKYILFLTVFIISLLSLITYGQNNNYVNYNLKRFRVDYFTLVAKVPAGNFKFNGEDKIMRNSDDSISFKSKAYENDLYMNFYLEKEDFEKYSSDYDDKIIELKEIPDFKHGKFSFKIYKSIIKRESNEESIYTVHAICKIKEKYTYNIVIESNKDFSVEEIKPFMDIKLGMNGMSIVIVITVLSIVVMSVVTFIVGTRMSYDAIYTVGKIINVEKLKAKRSGTPIILTIKYIDSEKNEIIAKTVIYRSIDVDYFDDKIGQDIDIKYLPYAKDIVDIKDYKFPRFFIVLLMSIFLIYVFLLKN